MYCRTGGRELLDDVMATGGGRKGDVNPPMRLQGVIPSQRNRYESSTLQCLGRQLSSAVGSAKERIGRGRSARVSSCISRLRGRLKRGVPLVTIFDWSITIYQI